MDENYDGKHFIETPHDFTEEDNHCGKPEMEDEQIRKAVETLKQSKVVGEVGTLLTTPCGKPHNNGEETCQECLTIKEGI